MKMQSSKLLPFFYLLWVIVWTVLPATHASAQTRPRLGLQFIAGQPTLSLTGVVGTVYSIQYATNVALPGVWVDRTLLQAQGNTNIWSDPSSPASPQRFYRAVSVASPADTNLVFIQPGTFVMGSPLDEIERSTKEPQHTVTISRGFWMGKYPVTQGQYQAVVGSNPSVFTAANGYTDNPNLPVESVSWNDATNYCALRTQQERTAGFISTNLSYRLPTESEWEYACRAGTTTAFYWGTNIVSEQANFNGHYEYDSTTGTTFNMGGVYLETTTPVGSYEVNPWGLYDMSGNVWELCQDWSGTYPAGSVIDPQGPVSGSFRILRGGDWYDHGFYCRSANRQTASQTFKFNNIGFRVVLSPNP